MTQVFDFIGGEYRNRTGVHGFAIRCVTTPPTRPFIESVEIVVRSLQVAYSFTNQSRPAPFSAGSLACRAEKREQ